MPDYTEINVTTDTQFDRVIAGLSWEFAPTGFAPVYTLGSLPLFSPVWVETPTTTTEDSPMATRQLRCRWCKTRADDVEQLEDGPCCPKCK